MTPHPGAKADVQHLQVLAERYLDVPRMCFLCAAWPAVAPLVYVGDAKGVGGRRRCAVFGACVVCLATDPSDFEHRVNKALRTVRPQEMAPWN
jgi:hypothetical protein